MLHMDSSNILRDLSLTVIGSQSIRPTRKGGLDMPTFAHIPAPIHHHNIDTHVDAAGCISKSHSLPVVYGIDSSRYSGYAEKKSERNQTVGHQLLST